ncbi:uncharacterized protein LOC135483355 isoform X2 [Lineus longissimus]|uniref:uncharacterized protein LOC135483355 isoform X2 n=1 Tax=Lineus longissimus TaxID=88925 RepID=UPI002B4D3149
MDIARQHRLYQDRYNKMDVRRAAFMDVMGGDKGVLVYLKRAPQTQVRKRSKAALGDMQEGDILLAANGVNCQYLSHSEAMETIDNSGDRLVLEIIRMPGGDPQAQPPQQSQGMVFNGGAQQNYAQQRSTRTTVQQRYGPAGVKETRTETMTTQGPYGGPQTTSVRREERSYGGGPVLQQVGNNFQQPSQFQPQPSQYQNPTSQFQAPTSQSGFSGGQPSFGGNQPSGGGGGVPMFKVKDVKGQQQQFGPSVVGKHVDDRGAITLNIAMSGQTEKENISPQFQPTQYEQQQEFGKPQQWQPQQEYYEPQQELPGHDMMEGPPPPVPLWEGHQPGPRQQEEPMRPYEEMDSGNNHYDEQYFEHGMEPETYDVATPKLMPATPGMKPVSLSKLLQESFDETPPESPSRLRKMILDPSIDYTTASKKVYSDSAFFEDSLQSFPTVEEQIKLARSVANVLTTEAAMQNSRGAKMFTKRKERAEKWIHENELEGEPGVAAPNKNISSQPAGQPKHKMYKCIDPDEPVRAPTWKPTPPPPPALLPKTKDDYGPTKLPSTKNVITPEQLEQIKLRAPKSQHNSVAPEKCFSLAAALHASKGRGGQIFAKRRAKSESWVVDEDNVKKAPPKPQVDLSAVSQARAGLKKTPKPSKTPWQAAMEHPHGDVDPAFEHLASNKRHTIGSDVFDSLTRKQGWPDPALPNSKTKLAAEKKEGPDFKNFNRKARGWGGGDNDNERWSTSSVNSEDSGSRKADTLPRSVSFKMEDDARSTPTFSPNRLQFDSSRGRMQPQIPHGATPPRMAFPVGGASKGATDL